ncbi:hypothetical protein [Streptomyces sp. CB02488]|uniref:hypothetical protein n=1 Tax=Streptomyces sp. CB02488 TaxID=1703920 RepID=UPI000B1360C4|nr:hypothetical protein [Streptomyces sp. CB02488]
MALPVAGAVAAGETALGPVVIGGAVLAVLTVIAAEPKTMTDLMGEGTDKTAFPNGGHWPVGTV